MRRTPTLAQHTTTIHVYDTVPGTAQRFEEPPRGGPWYWAELEMRLVEPHLLDAMCQVLDLLRARYATRRCIPAGTVVGNRSRGVADDAAGAVLGSDAIAAAAVPRTD